MAGGHNFLHIVQLILNLLDVLKENEKGELRTSRSLFPKKTGCPIEHRDMMGVQCDMWICLGFVKGDRYILYIPSGYFT